jgi:hypothetical protein
MATTTEQKRGEAALDLLRTIGGMLATGELGRTLDAAGDRGSLLRVQMMTAILDALAAPLPAASPPGQSPGQ